MGAPEEHLSPVETSGRPTVVRLVADSILLAVLARAFVVALRRARTISLPADWVVTAVSIALIGWVAADLRLRLIGRPTRPKSRLRRWFALRPAVCAWALLLPIAGWIALRLPGPMGEGPVAVSFDRAPWSKRPWHEGPVVVVSLGDSVSTGYGAPPGRGYVDLVIKNDPVRYPDVGDADLSSVLPRLARLKRASSSSNSIEHERSVSSIPAQPPDTFGVVFWTTGGIDLIHPYGHGEPREGAMYGATIAQASPWIERLRQRIDRTLVAIAGRFPGGCEIFVGTIYDPTDGIGDIDNAGPVFWLPPWPEALAIHALCNRAIRDACARHKYAHVVDVRRAMLGHGIHCRDVENLYYDRSDPTYWYWWNLEDPNERGYDAIRRAFLSELGTVLPRRFAAIDQAAVAVPR